ncbi:hypothetical protein PoB_005447100 [Plakobranchus ocellatus]|uniref:Uncharacterized protein n=1 Tax=Plakobranchus ocellatus TaxID=259542 RepID=A0AAV4C5H0_9GAST|nr:hypothetical protein PoB_005447100 [Plakobranchus ocellatus]
MANSVMLIFLSLWLRHRLLSWSKTHAYHGYTSLEVRLVKSSMSSARLHFAADGDHGCDDEEEEEEEDVNRECDDELVNYLNNIS